MASEYLKKKYADVKPDEPLVLTKKEKRQNWWDYHKTPLLIAAIVVFIIGMFIYDMITNVEPDYKISYFSKYVFDQEVTDQIRDRFDSFEIDANGDGKIKNIINSFILGNDYATAMQLTVDVGAGETKIFILEDPAAFQERYGIFPQRDGSYFEEGDDPADCEYYNWNDCAALADLDMFDGFYIARRMPQEGEEDTVLPLWEIITEGAEPVVPAEE